MKNFLTLLLILVVAACSSGSKETEGQDSVAASNDSLVAESVTAGESIQKEVEQAPKELSDTSQLEITYDETAGLVFERQEMFYTVSISTSQYEGSSDVTWYFDAEISPIYFKESWAYEGNEGSTEFFMEAGSVTCVLIEDSHETKKWCNTTGGIRTTHDDEAGETTEFIPFEYGKDCNAELSKYLDTLKAILTEGEKIEEDDDSYTYRIEKVVNYGEDVTESTTVKIPKKVYKGIME